MKNKLLRNIGIYYIILTLFSIVLSFYALLYLFVPLLPILILGIIFIICYATNQRGQLIKNLTELQLKISTIFLIVFPFIFSSFIWWYAFRPYKQAIVIPQNYEGVVTIEYNKPDGQEKKWVGGFLGIGASRLIEVNGTGTVKTQFRFHHNAIPFLRLKQTYHNRGGLKVYYEDDLENEIVKGANGEYPTYENVNDDLASIYFVDYSFIYKPHLVFAVTNKKRYNQYFMTLQNKIEQYEAVHKKHPEYPARLEDYHELNKNYKKYNDFK